MRNRSYPVLKCSNGPLLGDEAHKILQEEGEEGEVRSQEFKRVHPGGETSCIICFERPKSHLAVPCSHLCACGPCSELMQECPYCREPVMMWLAPRPV